MIQPVKRKEKGASFKPCDDRLWKMLKTLLDLTWNKIMFPSLISFFTPLHLRAYSQADWKLLCCLFNFSLKKTENLINWKHRKRFWVPDENWTLDLDALLTTELLGLYGGLGLIHWFPFSDAFCMFLLCPLWNSCKEVVPVIIDERLGGSIRLFPMIDYEIPANCHHYP